MSEKKNSTVGLQIESPSPIPHKYNYDIESGNLPKPLNLDEKKFLLAVERGDTANVRRMLQKALRKCNININCVDSFGRGALTLAIDGENLEMVELLIIMGVETKDALLEAINQEFVEAVELLLEHEELIHQEGEPYSWQKVDINLASYAPEITPLILASHKNNYEIIKLLLDRGATLPQPHDVKCSCDDCVRKSSEDSLRHSLSRVSEFRALASSSLIALSSNDPLQTAFQLSWELRNLAFAENECKSEYLELRKKCQQFAVDLLDQTRSSQELAIILNYDPKSQPYMDGDHMKLKRLEMAIDYKQKKFVAHPNIQQLLASLWYEGVPGFRRKSTIKKLLITSKVAALFPFYCLMYMIFPYCTMAKIIRKPFMKFLIHASSYLFFLLILILVSQRAEVQAIMLFGTEKMKETLTETLKRQRGNSPTLLELLVMIYVIGFIWEETLEIFNQGIRSYLRNMWNFIDFTRNFLYCLVFCFRCLAFFQQSNQIREDPNTAFIPREQWNDFDPQLIAEGLFAAANIFSTLKLVHLFSINPHLGPLQVSLGRMVIDIVKFFFIYTLVLFAFACGLNQLLWYYADLEKNKCYSLPLGQPDWNNEAEACMKWRRFGNLFESSQSLFWASFGMVGLENFELLGIKTYTRFWGLLMFGSYSVINVIVLLNLLIAMMSNSYALIEQHADTEWKFARTKLWMSYFEESATLPPPFNIFPTVKNVMKCFREKSARDIKKESTIRRKEEQDRANRYTNVMRSLVWRYVSAMHRKYEENPVTEDDINEVKGEISTMRYELLEVFSKNGMDVSSADRKEKTVLGKRMKVWERRLMKDFQVAPVEQPDDDVQVPEELTHVAETPLDRFRRISKQVASQSANAKWNVVIRSTMNSQIGRCRNRESFNNQQNLMKAMEQAKRLIERSPIPMSPVHGDPYNMDQTNQTLVQLLKNISEEINDYSPINTLRLPASSRSTTPLATLNAQLQAMISRNPSPNPTMHAGRSNQMVNQRSSSLDRILSPPLEPLATNLKTEIYRKSSEEILTKCQESKRISKNRSPTPDSCKSFESIPIIEITNDDTKPQTKPKSPPLIDLNCQNNAEESPLKQQMGSPVKVIERKAPAPTTDQHILCPEAAKNMINRGMISALASKEESKVINVPSLFTTPATPLLPQKPPAIASDITSSSEEEKVDENLSKQPSTQPVKTKITAEKIAIPEPSSVSFAIACGSSASNASTEKLITTSDSNLMISPAIPKSPSVCLRPLKKIEDVKTILRKPKSGWI